MCGCVPPLQDTAYVQRLERLSDAAVRLESFAGSEKEQNPVYREYHGLFHLRSLPRLNSLAPHLPETLDLAFKLKRKKFSIEVRVCRSEVCSGLRRCIAFVGATCSYSQIVAKIPSELYT